MKVTKQRVALLFCSAAVAALAGSAIARPKHRAQGASAPVARELSGADRDQKYSFLQNESVSYQSGETRNYRASRSRSAKARAAAQAHADAAYGGMTTNGLVAEARKYIGTNPTGRGSLWCGAFMDLVLKRTGHKGGGNLAKAYANYGTRVSGPQIGAIAVMRRRGGGHVGVVSGIDANGNPIIVSGNHNHTVAESVYPRSRITAYVMPGG